MKKRLLACLLLLSPLAGAEELKSYDSVITSKAKSDKGVFTVHRVGEKLYYEIPPQALNRDFLMVTQVARTKAHVGAGGDPVDQRVVRWVRREDRILLEGVDYSVWADPKDTIRRGVDAANENPILFAFNVETEGKGGSAVVEVSKMFLSDSVEFSPRSLLGGRSLEKDRSFLESARSYTHNIEVECTLTLSRPKEGSASGNSSAWGASMPPGSATVRMHSSMVLLPEKPMKPRLHDLRVGYFTVGRYNYSENRHGVKPDQYIRRWRLEKKDAGAALSEPVQPITFYIDPATPPKWVPYIKKGVEAWQPAFEAAGFKNAIVALDAPAKDWAPEDARYSTIRWLPSPVRNAYGPTVCDPRSGEILDADIHVFHNILDLLRTWYLVQVGPLDPRCRSLPLPDDLMGELLAMVITHEVGHSLGLPHNMKASSQYALEKIRDPQWVHTMGHTPTLMDYARFNYVAQPEDKIPAEDLLPKIGPYDRFSIRWGYAPLGPAEEKTTLDRWAREQDKTPWLRFSTPGAQFLDPGDQTEAVGDADPVGASRLGLKNLHRVAGMLVNSTSHYGEPYDDLKQMWDAMLSQYLLEMNHVTQLVGGVYTRQKYAGQIGTSYLVVSATRQRKAVQFLVENVFQSPEWLLPRSVLARLSPTGASRRLELLQNSVLNNLVQPARLERLVEQTQANPRAYSAAQLFEDLRAGLFAEFASKKALEISPLRRQLQSRWVDQLTNLNRRHGEIPALAYHELRVLLDMLRKHRKRATDVAVLAHLEKLEDTIVRQLDPRAAASAAPAANPPLIIVGATDQESCWAEPFDLDAILDSEP